MNPYESPQSDCDERSRFDPGLAVAEFTILTLLILGPLCFGIWLGWQLHEDYLSFNRSVTRNVVITNGSNNP